MRKEIKEIDVDLFESACGNLPAGLETLQLIATLNTAVNCIVKFFCNNSQKYVYCVTGDVNRVSAAFQGDVNEYAKFGIYDANVHNGVIQQDIPTILYVNAEQPVIEQVAAHRAGYGEDPEYAVIVDLDFESKAEELHNLLPQIVILNKKFESEEPLVRAASLRPTDAVMYDITDRLERIQSATIESVTAPRILAASQFLTELENLPYNPHRVFCITGGSYTVREAFLALAVVLTYHGFNCEIPTDDLHSFIGRLNSVLKHENMILGDYLRKLAYPPSVAVFYSMGVGYLCALNDESDNQFHDFKLSVIETTLDSDWRFKQNVRTVEYSYSELESRIIDPVEFFKLDSTQRVEEVMPGGQVALHAEGMKNYRKLTTILTEFEQLVFSGTMKKSLATGNCTNLLFYSGKNSDGSPCYHIGFVSRLPEVQYKYRCQQLCNGSRQFVKYFSRDTYDRLLDVRLIDGGQVLAQMVRSSGMRVVREHFEMPRFLRGYLMQMYKTGTKTIDDYFNAYGKDSVMPDVLSPAEVGLWSGQTLNGRTFGLTFMLSRFDRIVLHERRYLSFWGGCHPMDLTDMIFDAEIWGGKR